MPLRPPLNRLVGVLLLAVTGAATACGGAQSALDPAGRDAASIADTTYWLASGAAVLWLGVIGLAIYATRSDRPMTSRTSTALIVGGGVVLPLVVLPTLLVAGLSAMPRILALSDDNQLTLDVVGAQWWWRIRYERPGQPAIEVANEIRLPVGVRVNTRLSSADVIHSFWIPSLAGKMDMIPGRINRLALEPTGAGAFRGACAEFCGLSHARMNLTVVATDRAEFEGWLRQQAGPAVEPSTPAARHGREAFMTSGCATCHRIRGTPASGVSGPDLTHVAGRSTIAAGALRATAAGFEQWITHTHAVKPGARMPAFAHLPREVLSALAEYLVGLR